MKNTIIFSIILLAYININAQATDFATGLNNPIGLSIKGNDLYVAESDDSKIIKVALQTPNSSKTKFIGTWYVTYIDTFRGDRWDSCNNCSVYLINDTIKKINSNIKPISPYITFNDDLTITGKGACNTFTGTFTVENKYDVGHHIALTFTITRTNFDCGSDLLNDYGNSLLSGFDKAFFVFIGDNRASGYGVDNNILKAYGIQIGEFELSRDKK